MKVKRFKLTDQSMNSYGFRTLTSGIDLSKFNTNPVMLHLHNQANLLGKWTNVQTDTTGEITAEPEFNDGNDYAKARKQEVEAGYLNGASIGMKPVVFSLYKDCKDNLNLSAAMTAGWDDNDLILVKCQLEECTLCAVPSNGNALQLYHSNGTPFTDTDIKQIKLSIQSPSNNVMDKKEICAMLGIPETTPDTEVRVLLQNMRNQTTNAGEAMRKLKEMEDKNKTEGIKLMLDKAEADKKFLPTQRKHYEKLAEKDMEGTKELLDSITPVVNLSGNTRAPQQEVAGREAWTFLDYMQKDSKALKLMEETDPAKFATLFEKQYGAKPKYENA